MRLFLALDIDDAIRERIAVFLNGVRGFAPEARWAKPESLHVTLKFIGEKPDGFVQSLKEPLGGLRGAPIELSFRGYGFFPTPKSPRVFWIGIQAGAELGKLAAAVDDIASKLGVAKEDHAFSPHLTVARRGGGSGAPGRQKGDGPNRDFQKLQEKLSALPALDFGSMTARDFYLYRS